MFIFFFFFKIYKSLNTRFCRFIIFHSILHFTVILHILIFTRGEFEAILSLNLSKFDSPVI